MAKGLAISRFSAAALIDSELGHMYFSCPRATPSARHSSMFALFMGTSRISICSTPI